MVMRGIKSGGVVSSLVTRGAFQTQADTRADFLHMAGFKNDSQAMLP
jgi:hypothetical protein